VGPLIAWIRCSIDSSRHLGGFRTSDFDGERIRNNWTRALCEARLPFVLLGLLFAVVTSVPGVAIALLQERCRSGKPRTCRPPDITDKARDGPSLAPCFG
jgi:hypothetical protein